MVNNFFLTLYNNMYVLAIIRKVEINIGPIVHKR